MKSWLKYLGLRVKKLKTKLRVLLYEKPRGLDYSRYGYEKYKHRIEAIGYEEIGDRDDHYYDFSPTAIKQYLRSDEDVVAQLLDLLKITNQDAIIDIGCGKGSMLAKFAKYTFGKITGVELIPELADIAKQNLSILKLNHRVEIINNDAAQFTNFDDFNYIYMYNPLPSPVMQVVAQNIIDSLHRAPRRLKILYYFPLCHQDLVDLGFRVVDVFIPQGIAWSISRKFGYIPEIWEKIYIYEWEGK